MTLIDKDQMEKHIMESKVFNQYFKELVQSLIWGEKTIEAVEVVRCRQCEHWEELWNHTHQCEIFKKRTPSIGFCSYGELSNSQNTNVAHGNWIISSDGYYPYCSICKEEPKSGEKEKVCPNCGAKMDGLKKEES